jgi:hypothetical protein
MADNSRFVQPQDFFTARVVKYVPSEFLAPYTALVGAAQVSLPEGAHVGIGIALIVVYLAAVVLTVIFRLDPAKAATPDQRLKHLIVSPLAGLTFAYPIAAPLLGTLVNGFVVVFLTVLASALATFVIPKVPGGFSG